MIVKVMAVSPPNMKSGKIELQKYLVLASLASVDLVVFPSSYLPYYRNSTAFYSQSDIAAIPRIVPAGIVLIIGVNEATPENEYYKSVVACNGQSVLNIHRKVNIEEHYIQKGFSRGKGGDLSITVGGLTINTLECFETLFEENWQGAELITGSVGFGMMARTDNYDCDYFDQWLTMIKASCLRNKCFAILSCNAQHRDIMTVGVNSSGELIGLARTAGFFVIDIDLDDVRIDKQPFLQGKC
jgi:predicted amidohydrolase